MSAPKSDTPANALRLFEEEPLCVNHESPDALSSIDVLTFLDDYIADLDEALAAAQIEEETSDLLRSSKTSLRILSSSPSA